MWRETVDVAFVARGVHAPTSFLCHTVGVPGYRHQRIGYAGRRLVHRVERVRRKRRCRRCDARWRHLTLNGSFERRFPVLAVGRRPQFVVPHGHEQRCRRCGKRLRKPIDFAAAKGHCLKASGRFVIALCQFTATEHVVTLPVLWFDAVTGVYHRWCHLDMPLPVC